MGQDVRFIVVTSEDRFAGELRAILVAMEGVKLVAEVEEPALLTQAVQQFPVDVLLVNLDPAPDAILPIVADVAQANRNLAIFAASSSTEGSLILKAYRMGIKEFFPKPVEQKALEEAVEKVAANRVDTAASGRLICVVGTSGGVGASFIATNLAVELAALTSDKVTIVDLDHRFGQVATLLDVDPKYTLADLCASPEALEPQVITRALASHSTGVQVLSRPAHLAEADTITAASSLGVFSQLLQLNEYVVADGPTRFDAGGKAVLALSDVTFLVVQLLVPCVRNAQRMIQNMREHGYNLERAKLILNRVEIGSGHLSVKDVTETLGLSAFATIPNVWEAANGAVNLGEPLFTHSPKSKLRGAIQDIAERLHAPQSPSDDKDARKQGLLGRILAGG